MIKILFLINTLGGGGAERVMVNLINNMDKNKFDITVCTMFSDGVNREKICDDIKCYCKNKLGIKGLSKIIKFVPSSILYKYYVGKVKYDIVVGYMHGAPTKVVAGCNDKNIKTVTWLHNGDPSMGTFFDFWSNKQSAFNAYASLDAVVGVSKSVSKAFSSYTGIVNNVYTIYNTNDTKKIIELSNEQFKSDENVFIICTAGRLSKEKAFDRLINISKRLLNENFEFKIKILGEGPERDYLECLIKEKNVEKYVELCGFCLNPYNVMKASDVFVSSSLSEGLATVLTEALTLGLPVVSTDVSGAKEVLGENNEYGLVVDNSENGIYEGLKEIILNKELREHYKSVARKRAVIFDTEHTVIETEKFFRELLNNKQ